MEKLGKNEALFKDLAKGVKTQKDLSKLVGQLMKTVIETALNSELDDHLGYEKNDKSESRKVNTRNGYSPKTIKGDLGEIEIQNPRDRESSFEPQLVPKHKTRLEGFEEKILHLYARGMTTRDIQSAIKDMYNADVSHTVISNVTESIIEEVKAWQNRPLESIYPIVYLDCIVVKVHQDGRVINKAIYLALGVTVEGRKDLLGLWISENEGSKFWLGVLTDLQNRGVNDIFIFCVDGLTGFPDAISSTFPKAKIQLCIVHMVRNALRYVPAKDMKAVASDLKSIYNAPTREAAEQALDDFSEKWSSKYPNIEKSWRNKWPNLITIFDYPDEIRKVIYTTNAIESLNSVIRKAIKNRKIFPSDDSALKLIYLAVNRASQKWTMPIRNWKPALNRFAIEYGVNFEF
jgi:transposase-like protein